MLHEFVGMINSDAPCALVKTESADMVADIHTKGFTNAGEWIHVSRNSNMFYLRDLAEVLANHCEYVVEQDAVPHSNKLMRPSHILEPDDYLTQSDAQAVGETVTLPFQPDIGECAACPAILIRDSDSFDIMDMPEPPLPRTSSTCAACGVIEVVVSSMQPTGAYICPTCDEKRIGGEAHRLQRVGAGAPGETGAQKVYHTSAEVARIIKGAGLHEVLATDFGFTEASLEVCVSGRQKAGPFWTSKIPPKPHVTLFKHVFRENQANLHTYYGDSEAEEEKIEESLNEAEHVKLNFPAACETLLFRMLQMVATFSTDWEKIKHFPYTIYEAYVKLGELNRIARMTPHQYIDVIYAVAVHDHNDIDNCVPAAKYPTHYGKAVPQPRAMRTERESVFTIVASGSRLLRLSLSMTAVQES